MAIGTQGIFLGGVASGQRAAHTMGIQERGLALQEQQFEATERQQLMERTQADYDRTMGIIENLVGSSTGTTEELFTQSRGTIEALVTEAATMGQALGISPDATMATVGSLRTPKDIALAESRTTAEGRLAEADVLAGAGIGTAEAQATAGIAQPPGPSELEKNIATLRGMGIELSTKDIRIMGGVESMATDPAPTIVKLQQARDRALAEGRTEDAAQIENQINAIGTVTGRTPEDIAAVLGTGSRIDDATTGAVTETSNLDAYRSLFSQLNAIGEGATGLRGTIAEAGGGILSQANNALGDGFSQFVAGATQEEITSFRTDARMAVARLIPSMTGEDSGRITESERALATQASRLLAPDASFSQIKAALTNVTKLAFMDRDKQLFLSGRPFFYDLSSDEGRRAAVTDYISTGLSEDAALDLLRRSIQFQTELRGMRPDG